MTTETKPTHTPTPWQWDEPANWHGLSARICTQKYEPIAQVQLSGWPKRTGRANAAYIVRACNSLPGCVAALEAIIAHDDDLHTSRGSLFPLALMDQIRAALTAAKGDA